MRFASQVFALGLTLPAGWIAATPPSQFSGGSAVITSQSLSGISIDFDARRATVANTAIDGERYSVVAIDGEGSTSQPGLPALPAISRFIVLPPDKAVQLRVTLGESRTLPADPPPAPFPNADMSINPDAEFYLAGDIYPPEVAALGEPVIMRGVRMVQLTVYPVQFDPMTHTFIVHDRVKAELQFTDEVPVNPLRFASRRKHSRNFSRVIESLTLNPDAVPRDEGEAGSDRAGHYLVVARQECLPYAIPLIEWRRRSGYKVDILAYDDQQARRPSDIREDMRALYNQYIEAGALPFEQVLLIGDRRVVKDGVNAPWRLESFLGNTSWPSVPHADYEFGLLEGNDPFPEVGVGRFASGNQDRMELAVGRTLAYVRNPSLEDESWLTRAGVYSQRWGQDWNFSIPLVTRWGTEVLRRMGFEEILVQETDGAEDGSGNIIGPTLARWLNRGLNVMIGRAENFYWRDELQGVRENAVFPIGLNVSGHGEWTMENLFCTGSGDSLLGAVAWSTGWGIPSTNLNNAVWLALVSGFLVHDMPLGWARIYSGLAFPLNYPDQPLTTMTLYLTDTDLYGDPGLQAWKGVPRRVEAEFPASISPGTDYLDVFVHEPGGENPVSGAQVTLYMPGEIDLENYADFEPLFMMTRPSDGGGVAQFPIAAELPEGELQVTVTGRDIYPLRDEITITAQPVHVSVSGFIIDDRSGNDDGNANPSETIGIVIEATNYGAEDAAEDIEASITSDSPHIDIDNQQAQFPDLAPRESAVTEDTIWAVVRADTPDGQAPVLNVDFSTASGTFQSQIILDVWAASLEIAQIIGGAVIPDSISSFRIELHNRGRVDAASLTAELVSNHWGVSVLNRHVSYPSIAAGESSAGDPDGRFTVNLNRVVVPGDTMGMTLLLQSEGGVFYSPLRFELQASSPRDRAPQGPDAYGYYCLDDTDTGWDEAPAASWVEISRLDNDPDYFGTPVEVGFGTYGSTAVIDLPFTMRFYGEDFDQITVCSNGFVAVGDQADIINFQNYPMDLAYGGALGMIAPFWDWLTIPEQAGIFSHYVEGEGAFIIEWYDLHHRSSQDDLVFQLALFDPEVSIGHTGDSDMIFRYWEISQRRGGGADTPYASVGISSPDGTTGINYSYYNTYPPTSAPLARRRTILFTTMPEYRFGEIAGVVVDAENGTPLNRAVVYTDKGCRAVANQNGVYRIEGAFAGSTTITAHHPGFNDSSVVEVLDADDLLEVSFALLHPEFSVAPEALDERLQPYHVATRAATIRNTGNGELNYQARYFIDRRPDDSPLRHPRRASEPPQRDEKWGLMQNIPLRDITGDEIHYGVEFVDGEFLITSRASVLPGAPEYLSRISRDGRQIDRTQIDEPLRDLAWDRQFLYAVDRESVIIYNPRDLSEIERFGPPEGGASVVAVDPSTGVVYAAGISTPIYAMEKTNGGWRSTSEIDFYNPFLPQGERRQARKFGLAFFGDDPDGSPLYVWHYSRAPGGEQELALSKVNPVTGAASLVTIIPKMDAADRPAGMTLTNRWDNYFWVFAGIVNAADGDRLEIRELALNAGWLTLVPTSGRVPAGREQLIEFTIDPTDLWEGDFGVDVAFEDLQAMRAFTFAVRLNIDQQNRTGDEASAPDEWALDAVFPNPFNYRASVSYRMKAPGIARLTVYDLHGRLVRTLEDEYRPAGLHHVEFDAATLPSGIYIMGFEAGEFRSARKVALVK